MGYSVTSINATATGAASSMAPSLAAVAGQFTYCSGFSITGLGATAASGITATLSGVAGGPLNFVVPVPSPATAGVLPLIAAFEPPLQSTAVNTGITLTVPSFGTGNTAAACELSGFYAS